MEKKFEKALKILSQLIKKMKKQKKVNSVSEKVIESTTAPPVFHHPEIEQLYCNGMDINLNFLRQILSLPKQTLIDDLEKVAMDSIARYDFFSEKEWDDKTHSFILHSFFLLGELRSENSLPVILNVLRQDEEFIEFWFGDYITDEIWDTVYLLGQNRLEELKQFLFEPDNYTFARYAISRAVARIAIHQPHRKPEVIAWFGNVLDFFYQNNNNERIYDIVLLEMMIGDLMDIQATELLEKIKILYDEGLVSDSHCGNYKEVEKEMLAPSYPRHKNALLSIFEKYNNILYMWNIYNENEEEDYDEEEPDDYDEYSDYEDYEDYEEEENKYSPPVQFIREEPKIQRNAPCPCGSGKKFKKCCLNKNEK